MRVTAEVSPRIDAAAASPARGSDAVMVALFALTALMGSGLLFVVEPVVAKMLSPAYGGSPMVWTISLLFFQIALIAGYAYGHWSQRLLSARNRVLVQISLVISPFFVLPFTLPTWSGAVGLTSPALSLLLSLAMVVGAPLTALSTAGPLIQRWYSSSGLPRSNDPYFLFAAGNIGGVIALLAYPFVIEPVADLATQALWWMIAYGVFAALAVTCGLIAQARFAGAPAETSAEAEAASVEQVSWARRARWLGLAFVPTSLMLGVTTRISTQIAAMPLIWVLPLALYVATLAVAFGLKRQRWVPPVVMGAAISAAGIPWALYLHRALATDIVLCLSLIVVAGLACHGLLALDRPTPSRRSEFFVIISLGGALGAAFNGLLVPVIFDWDAELPLVVTALAILPLVLCQQPPENTAGRFETSAKAFILTGPLLAVATYLSLGSTGLAVVVVTGCLPWCVLALSRPRMMAVGVVLTTVGLFWYDVQQTPEISFRERTFFRDYNIYFQRDWLVLSDGTTVRGYQYPTAPVRWLPVSYYGRPGPLGDLFTGYGDRSSRIAVVGPGTGAEASYGHRGQQMDFYEPDRAALDIAFHRFGYVRDSEAKINPILGDGRLRLGKVPDASYALIILDAFDSGAVPIHLLTREALQMYARKLRPGGVIAFQVTTGNLDLAPVLRATARSAGLASMTGYGIADPKLIYQPSTWVAIAQRNADLQPLRTEASRWWTLPTDGPVWTDAHISPFGVLKSN